MSFDAATSPPLTAPAGVLIMATHALTCTDAPDKTDILAFVQVNPGDLK
jgi:hypothetical protein